MPSRPQTKTRIANQIFQHAYGFDVRVKHQGTLYTAPMFALDTPLYVMQQWQLDKKKALDTRPLETSAPSVTNRHRPSQTVTLEARVETFFPQIAGRVSFKADRSHLRAWLLARGADGQAIGAKTPAAITPADVNVAIAAWRTPPPAGTAGQPRAVRRITVTPYRRYGKAIDGYARTTPTTSGPLVVAIRTVRHRCRLLREFLVAEGLPPTAIDSAKIPAVEKGHPVGVDLETIRVVAQALAKVPAWADTYGRYLVLNSTAQRPTQVMRAEPGDVKLEAKLWIVRSAKGAPAHTITLNTDMLKAWRVFVAAKAWGVYDTSLHAKRLRACGWPAAIRPYNARHSVAQDALQSHDVNLDDVQGLLGHTTPQMTRSAYGPLALDRQRRVSDAIDGRLKGVFGPRLVKKGG